MTELKKKLADQCTDFSWLTKQDIQNQPSDSKPWPERIQDLAGRMSTTVDNMCKNAYYEPEYDKEYRNKILAMPQRRELAVHFMALPGYSYRHYESDIVSTTDKLYELARHTREAGATQLRTFMVNGSRARTEKYIADALPWVTVISDGKKKVDFSQPNKRYYESCAPIERACKYWDIDHCPTYWMDRYNYDIFRPENNVQGINGYRSLEAQAVKIKFMVDYVIFQRSFRTENWHPPLEFENEPFHHGDHRLGALIADQNLEMFRALQKLNVIIDYCRTCSGTSEFSHANFVGPQYFADIGRWLGSEEFATRLVKAEWHGVSTLTTLMSDLLVGLGSAWRHLCYNEDGCNDGSYDPIPWTPYFQANYQELFDMVWYGTSQCWRRNKRFYFTIFMMDCLAIDPKDGIAKETYNLNKMNWKRIQAPIDAIMELANE